MTRPLRAPTTAPAVSNRSGKTPTRKSRASSSSAGETPPAMPSLTVNVSRLGGTAPPPATAAAALVLPRRGVKTGEPPGRPGMANPDLGLDGARSMDDPEPPMRRGGGGVDGTRQRRGRDRGPAAQ